jgi:hypothetical protein
MQDVRKSRRVLALIITGLCAYLCAALMAYVPYLIYVDKLLQGDLSGSYPYPKALIAGAILQYTAIIASFAAIFWGIRRIRNTRKSIQHWLIVIIGIGICILFFNLNFVEYNKLDKFCRQVLETDVIAKLEAKLAKGDLPQKARILCEGMLAKEIYVNQGRLISITDQNGTRSLFKPSGDDMAYKKTHDFLKRSILRRENTTRNGSILWIAVLFLSIILGRFWPAAKIGTNSRISQSAML